MTDQCLTIAQAAERLGLSTVTVERWVRQGILPAVRLGGRRNTIRLSERALTEWLSRQPKAEL